MSAERKPTSCPIRYWISAAREQNRWRIQLRSEAQAERRCRKSGALYDESRRCRERRDVFMAEARRARYAVASTQGAASHG